MNLYQMLSERAEAGNPIRVGLVGAGRFGAMYLAQARQTKGIHILGIADLNPRHARNTCSSTGWLEDQISAASFDQALQRGTTYITDDTESLIKANGLDVLIEATGDPGAGIRHCLRAIDEGRHVIMVNVEADAVAGPLLALKARKAGVIYSLAYGDQPAIICEQVDWARTSGFEVVSAGKGTRYHPSFHESTPETVWDNFGFSRETVESGELNPKMHNSFIDGSKSAIEMTAVCNATGLTPQPGGLGFPPSSFNDLAELCKPESAGGTLSHSGTTEVVSSIHRDMSQVENHIQMGTFVVVEAAAEYTRQCIRDYRFFPDRSFRYAAMYRPVHMIGLELGISVASVVMRREPTGSPTAFLSDVVATAKSDLKAGTLIDGEGGYFVWGKQMPARRSLDIGGLPLGLSHNARLLEEVKAGQPLRWQDVEIDENDLAVRIRREMEDMFG